MSRGHKIVANFLKKRGAWDNNPYKETEMKKELPPPFEPDKKPKKFATAGKAGYGPSAARHLAQLGLKQQMLKVNPKLAETWDAETLNELSKKTLGSYVKKATGGLEGAANQAYEAGRRGTEGGENFATAVKRVKGVEKAVNKMTKEAVSYSGLGTDVVDKKKKLNPQPALTMKPKQVKDFKEENIAELKASTLQSYADKAHQQALDATYDAAHLNRSGEEKLKADAKRLASKRAGGVQMAQTKLDRMKESLDLSHGIGDTVRCKRTNRMATVAGFDNDKYTVVYADGSTETGPADWWTSVTKITHSNGLNQDTITNEQAVAPVVKNYYKGIRLHFARGNRGGKSGSNKGGPASDSSADAGDGGSGGDGGGV